MNVISLEVAEIKDLDWRSQTSNTTSTLPSPVLWHLQPWSSKLRVFGFFTDHIRGNKMGLQSSCIMRCFTFVYLYQGCKFSGNCLNSGFHEVQIPALLFIFSPFLRILAQIRAFFSEISGSSPQVSLHPCFTFRSQ